MSIAAIIASVFAVVAIVLLAPAVNFYIFRGHLFDRD